MGENKTDVLEMMAVNEEEIRQLYKIYSEKFPQYRDFWWGLAVEETQHAVWIRELRQRVNEGGHIYLSEDRFDIEAIKRFHDCVKVMLDVAEKREISLEEALSNSLSIEYNLIENKFFEVFEADSDVLKFVLKVLHTSTNEHKNRVQEALNKIRKD